MEAARKDSHALSCQQAQVLSDEAPEQANVVASGENDSGCFRCGGGHSARWCRHGSTICHNCRQKGHLARVCRVQPGSRNFDRSQSSRVNNVGDLPVSAEEHEVFNSWTLQTASSEPMRIAVEVNGVMLDMELDTGASVSTIDGGKFAELFPSVPLEPSSVQLRSFFGDMKRVLGKLEAMVKLGDKERQPTLFVVKMTCPTLFGRSWMMALKLGIAQTEGVNVLKSTEDLKGPKFALPPSLSAHELVGLNRDVSAKASQDRDRCLQDGVRKEFPSRSRVAACSCHRTTHVVYRDVLLEDGRRLTRHLDHIRQPREELSADNQESGSPVATGLAPSLDTGQRQLTPDRLHDAEYRQDPREDMARETKLAVTAPSTPVLRRSTRVRRPVSRYSP
ncbi:hypothetical protein HPB50_027778 [Hyalomma asiaticum]|nr:hypothetical protein HPB50_027778 [Hyalomma asiaticum]